MTDSLQLSSGLFVPRGSVQMALKSATAVARQTVGGSWTKGSPIAMAMGDGGQNARTNRLRDFDSYLHSPKTIPWMFQAGTTVVQSYAAAEWSIVNGRKGGTVPEDDPDLNDLLDLLDEPNPYMDGQHLRELLGWHVKLTGNGFLVMDDQDALGRPHQLYLLRPSRVRIVPDPKVYIKTMFYEVNGAQIEYNPANVIWFKLANPTDQYWGLGVCESGEYIFNKLRAIARTEMNFFDSGARVKGVLTYDGTLSHEQELALRQQFRVIDEGQSGEFRTAILQEGLDYKTTQSDLLANGPGMSQLAKDARDEALAMWGVPKQKVGIFDDASYRSIEADSFFQAETMTPFLRATDRPWTQLTRRWNSTWRFRHKSKVVTDYYDKAMTAHFQSQSACFKRDEIRIQAGLDPLDENDPRGSEIVGPANMTIFNVGGPAAEVPLPGPGSGATHPATPERSSTDESDDAPTPPTLTQIAPGAKSTPACSCPPAVAVGRKALATATARSLGICPQHAALVDQHLSTARARRYSARQVEQGFPQERYPALASLIGR